MSEQPLMIQWLKSKNFIRKAVEKQAPPGPPPRPGLQWKPTTHRWIRPKEQASQEQVSEPSDQPVSNAKRRSAMSSKDWKAYWTQRQDEQGNKKAGGYDELTDWWAHLDRGGKVADVDVEDFPGQDLLRDGTDLRESLITGMSDKIWDHILNKYGQDDIDEDTGLPHDWDLQDVRNFVDDSDNVDPRMVFEDLGGDVGELMDEDDEPGKMFYNIVDEAVNEVVEGFKSGQATPFNIKKTILESQPGPPPRQGLQWKPSTHRWIRPREQDADQDGPERDDSSDYWADFDINEHKDGIKNYLDEVWTDYNHLSPDKIQSEILMPLIEDLDIVLPDDDEGMDKARESLEGYLGEAIQRKKLSSMGRTGRQLGRMGESEQGTQTSFLSEISTSGTGGDDTLTVGSVSITKVQREALQEFFTGIARKHEDTVFNEIIDSGLAEGAEEEEAFGEDVDFEPDHDELWSRVVDHILESISGGDYDNQIGLLKVGIPEDDDSQEAIHEIIMNNVAVGVTKYMGPPDWLDAQGNPKKEDGEVYPKLTPEMKRDIFDAP